MTRTDLLHLVGRRCGKVVEDAEKDETASKQSSLGSDIIRSSTVSIVFGANRSPAAGRSSISRMGRMCSSERNFQSGISRLNMTVAVSHLASAYAASRLKRCGVPGLMSTRSFSVKSSTASSMMRWPRTWSVRQSM